MSSLTFVLGRAAPGSPSTTGANLSTDANAPSLPSAPALHLLPFALGPASAPLSSRSAPIPAYFQPRPAPAGLPGVVPGTPIAAFRGRQVVGQRVRVPRGYRGVVLGGESVERVKLGLGLGMGLGGGERTVDGAGKGSRGLGTPNQSTESVGSTGESSRTRRGRAKVDENVSGRGEGGGDGDDLSLRRDPRSRLEGIKQRVVGAGQTALARPKRAVARMSMARKRVRMDSSDESDGDGDDNTPKSTSQRQTVVPPTPPRTVSTASIASAAASASDSPARTRTPSKRARMSIMSPTPTEGTRQSPRFRVPRTPVQHAPTITLQEATPLRSPLPPPPPHMTLRPGGRADFVIGDEGGNEDERQASPSPSGVALPSDEGESTDVDSPSGALERQESATSVSVSMSAGIIPSPATENDPPTFDIGEAKPIVTEDVSDVPQAPTSNRERDDVEDLDVDGPVRVLRPSAGFSEFMLWTPDGALPGYVEPPALGESESDSAAAAVRTEQTEGGGSKEEVEEEERGPKVRQGWWAPEGGGEGGDEVVRALGEWIGLVEMIHDPVYLADCPVEDDEDDED